MPTRPRPPQHLAKALGKRIRDLRGQYDWSQERLAEESGLHRTFIAGIEVGLRNPSLASLARIAKALRVEISDLFSRS